LPVARYYFHGPKPDQVIYTVAGKRVNRFVFPLLIDTNIAGKVRGRRTGAGLSVLVAEAAQALQRTPTG
jgi:hypothetical protein